MLGTDREPGIMGKALNDLFSEMEQTKEEMAYRVTMSYLEVCCWQSVIFLPGHLSVPVLLIYISRSVCQFFHPYVGTGRWVTGHYLPLSIYLDI